MECKVYNSENAEVSLVELSDHTFAQPLRLDILSRVIEWQLAKRRAGTHKTKEIGDVRGSTKKIVKQKGSGGARHGSKRGPQFRGGAVIFGPVVRSHGYSLPKKIRSLGLRTALSEKLRAGNLIIVDNVNLDEMKTKAALAFLKKFDISRAVVLDSQEVASTRKAFSNIHEVTVLPVVGANVYDIMRHDKLIMTVDALKDMEARFKND